MNTATPMTAQELNPTRVLIVDSRLPDYQSIVDAAEPGVMVIVLDKNQDGVKQIANALKGMQGIESISIVSHGDHGMVLLGDGPLHSGNLDQYAEELQAIGSTLSADGDIALYGCDVGVGADGQAFIEALAEATGADVGASTDDTGTATRGGDWELEIATGTLDALPVLDVSKLNNWGHLAHTASVSSYAQLVSAISSAVGDNSDDTITLTSNITLGTGQTITVNVTDGKTLTIVGGAYTLSGGNVTRVLSTSTTNSNSAIAIQNLTITNGFVSGDGGSNNLNGAGGTGGSGLGGAIYNQGTLTITGSTITGNKASAGGGGGGTTSGLYGGGGGGGGGGYGSGVGGKGGTGAGGSAGASGSPGNGGDGGGSGGRGGGGGGTTGGAGSTYTGAGYTAGGTGGSAVSGSVKIGGGGGGTGTNGMGGAGGDAAGGIYNTATGTITILNSTVTNNIAAGGGGGGGGSADFASTGNGGDGGRGVGGIWNAGGGVFNSTARQPLPCQLGTLVLVV